jgi:hypothetical protein
VNDLERFRKHPKLMAKLSEFTAENETVHITALDS